MTDKNELKLRAEWAETNGRFKLVRLSTGKMIGAGSWASMISEWRKLDRVGDPYCVEPY